MMINQTELIALTIAIRDYADALATASDSSIDDAQLTADALFDLIDADMRADADYSDLPAAIDPALLDDLDRDAYNQLRTAYIALLNARP